MRLITIIFLSIISISTFAENGKIDSLYAELKKNNKDTTNLRLMNDLAREYYYFNADSCLFYSFKVIEQGAILNTIKGKSSSINRIGLIKLDQADYKEAIVYFLRALELAEEEKNNTHLAYLYNNVGISYSAIDDFENAEKYLLKALEYYNKLDDTESNIGILYNNLSIIAQEKDDYEKQFKYLTAAILEYKKNGDSLQLAVSKINLSSYYQVKEEYDVAIKLINEAIVILEKSNSSPYLAKSYTALAYIYENKKDYEKALGNLFLCLQVCNKGNVPDAKMDAYKLYSDIYESQGKHKKAYEYFSQYSELKDSLLNETKQKQISELNVKYETVKKDKEIALLNKEQELQKERIDTQKKLLIGLIVLIALIVVFSVILFFLKRRQFLSYKDLVKKNIEIIEKEQQIEESDTSDKKVEEIPIPEIARDNTTSEDEINDSKYTHSTLDHEQKEELAAVVLLSMKKDKLFLDQDLTINKLAKQLGINRTYLSQVINEFYNKNFSSFINEFRIKEATKRLLLDRNITIEAVSNDVGFKSKSAFNNAFKQYTGVTPSFFIKNSQEGETDGHIEV